jgi:hypothetical protein
MRTIGLVIGMRDAREVGAAADALVRALEPDALALSAALPMWEAFDRIERSAATAKLLLTARVHHHQKHHEGWSLVEGTGKRAFVPPEDPRHPKNRPKRE